MSANAQGIVKDKVVHDALMKMPHEALVELFVSKTSEHVHDQKAVLTELEILRGRVLDQRLERGPPKFSLRSLSDIVEEKREPQWLIHRVLEKSVLGVLAGPRSSFKSFIGLHWMMKAALVGHSVLVLSGEGAGLDRRVDAWMRVHGQGAKVEDLKAFAIERPLNLNLISEMQALVELIDASGSVPAAILIDTFSKFSAGIDENSNAEVAAFLSRLAESLRDRYGATVLLVVHTGHADSKRPRGASALMANPDAEYIVGRPDPTAMSVSVTRERFKDTAALDPLAYEVEVVDLGRTDSWGEVVTSLVLRPSEAVLQPVRPELVGKNQRLLLQALKARREGGTECWSLTELRRVCRETGMTKSSARTAAEALALSPFMVPQLGGYRLSDDA